MQGIGVPIVVGIKVSWLWLLGVASMLWLPLGGGVRAVCWSGCQWFARLGGGGSGGEMHVLEWIGAMEEASY